MSDKPSSEDQKRMIAQLFTILLGGFTKSELNDWAEKGYTLAQFKAMENMFCSPDNWEKALKTKFLTEHGQTVLAREFTNKGRGGSVAVQVISGPLGEETRLYMNPSIPAPLRYKHQKMKVYFDELVLKRDSINEPANKPEGFGAFS
jgi:hypothetical protein